MLGGILAGALSGGAQMTNQIASSAIKQRDDAAMRELEQKLALEREAQVARLREAIRREGQEYDTVGRGGENALEYKRKEGGVLLDLDRQRNDLLLDLERRKNDIATQATIDRGNNPEYIGATQKLTDAGSPTHSKRASEASAERTRQIIDMASEERKLRGQLADAVENGDMATAQKIQSRIGLLSGAMNKSPERSYSDVVQAARNLKELAEQEEQNGNIEEADRLRNEAKRLLLDVGDARGFDARAGGKAPTAGAPYREGTRLIGPDGKLYIVENGKPVLYGSK